MMSIHHIEWKEFCIIGEDSKNMLTIGEIVIVLKCDS